MFYVTKQCDVTARSMLFEFTQYKFTCYNNNRSFGVLLWEIFTYGRTPLADNSIEDIIDAAQNGSLYHTR